MVVLATLFIGLGPYIGQVFKTVVLFEMDRFSSTVYLEQMKIYHMNHMCFLQESFVAS